jgi:prolipoprotein diacylglyceryltransferase
MTDLLALYAVPSLFLQRVCCLIAGCCQGNLIPGTEMRWPTRELELVFYVLLFVYFLRKEKSETFIKGSLFPILMISYGTFRFLEEGFREADGTSFAHMAHLWSILAIIIGVCIYTELTHNRGNKNLRSKRRGTR